jgi:hypothetical protein
MAARRVRERVQLATENLEPFALSYSLAIDAARRNPRELVSAWFSAPFALDASASSAEPHAPAADDQEKPKRPVDALTLVASKQQRCRSTAATA